MDGIEPELRTGFDKLAEKYTARLNITFREKPISAKLSEDSEMMAIYLVEPKNRVNKIPYRIPILEHGQEVGRRGLAFSGEDSTFDEIRLTVFAHL